MQVGEVRTAQVVRPAGAEVALDEVRRPQPVADDDSGPWEGPVFFAFRHAGATTGAAHLRRLPAHGRTAKFSFALIGAAAGGTPRCDSSRPGSRMCRASLIPMLRRLAC